MPTITRRSSSPPAGRGSAAAGELADGRRPWQLLGQLTDQRGHTPGFSEVRGPGVAAITLDGAAGGSASGVANVSASEDPVEILERCSGSGLRRAAVELRLASPGISG